MINNRHYADKTRINIPKPGSGKPCLGHAIRTDNNGIHPLLDPPPRPHIRTDRAIRAHRRRLGVGGDVRYNGGHNGGECEEGRVGVKG